MLHSKITFFPIGNADTTLIQIEKTGKSILWDYANMRSDSEDDKRCDLPAELNGRIKGDFDVVCFTHADEDHIYRMSEYFYLEHDPKFQKGDRKKIKELWVPAAVILDKEAKNDDDKNLQNEARFRLRRGTGIKIFSKPDKLKEWLKKENIPFEKIKHLLVDAGTLVPGWNKNSDGIEFFAHSPFVGHVDDSSIVDRNDAAIIAQAVFGDQNETKLMLGADGHSDTWRDIVKITRYHKNEERLLWDIFHISHHCSYNSLNCEEKGKQKTIPVPEIKWLFETQGNQRCVVVSPSDEITFGETVQPPHFQAYNYYKEDVCEKKTGEIVVTMEWKTKTNPEPLVINIDDTTGAAIDKSYGSIAFVTNRPAPKAG